MCSRLFPAANGLIAITIHTTPMWPRVFLFPRLAIHAPRVRAFLGQRRRLRRGWAGSALGPFLVAICDHLRWLVGVRGIAGADVEKLLAGFDHEGRTWGWGCGHETEVAAARLGRTQRSESPSSLFLRPQAVGSRPCDYLIVQYDCPAGQEPGSRVVAGNTPRVAMTSPESQLENDLVEKLLDLKYGDCEDIRDRAPGESHGIT